MSQVSLNGQRLIPSPLIEYHKVFDRTTDGRLIGSHYEGSIIGTIVSYKGSPSSTGVWWTSGGYPPDESNLNATNALAHIIRKQEAIRELFATDGLSCEIASDDGSPPISFNPIITGIEFGEDTWYYLSKYNISFTAQQVFISGTTSDENNFTDFISDAKDSWVIETNEDLSEGEGPSLARTYKISHNISAVGKLIFNGAPEIEPWERARTWVLARLGFDPTKVTNSVTGITGAYNPYNYVRGETIDGRDGSYAVTEVWDMRQNTATEELNIEVKKSIDQGLTSVSINGVVTGVAEVNSDLVVTITKYENAQNLFDIINGAILSRAQSYSGVTLNPTPLNATIAYNPINGIITYNSDFDDRPSNLITGSASETFSISDNLGTNIIAVVPVLGRTVGPVLQNINTSRELSRTLNIELVMEFTPLNGISAMLNSDPILFGPSASDIQAIVDAANPATAFKASQSYLVENTHSYEPRSRRCNVTKTWIYEQ